MLEEQGKWMLSDGNRPAESNSVPKSWEKAALTSGARQALGRKEG